MSLPGNAQAPYPNYAPPYPNNSPAPSYPPPNQPSSAYPYQGHPYQTQPYQAQSPYPQQAPDALRPSTEDGLPPSTEDAPRLAAQQLSNLVAPIALYPDLLLSEVLAASTYPLELVQAEQWMQANPALQGRALVDAAKQQNWDPSIQALVAFPDVMNMLTRDIQWTTALGNAFLAQQADVMDAIQQLRAEARANGRLTDTPQQRVMVDQENGQSAIVIQPTDPQVVYPPVYNPAYVWGPPVYGAYPALPYPSFGYGIYYAVGTFLGVLFSGLLSFGGWGWGLSWLSHGLFLNALFFSHFGFHGFGGAGYYGGRGYYAARTAWVHNPAHRLGVPYGNRSVAARFGGGYAGRGGSAFASNFRNSYARNGYSGRSFDAGRSGSYGSGYQGASRQAEAYRGLTSRESRGSSYGGSSYRNGASGYNSGARDAARNYGSSFRGSAPRASSERFSSHYSAPKESRHFGGGGGGRARGGGGHSGGGHGHSGGGGHGGGGHSHGHRK